MKYNVKTKYKFIRLYEKYIKLFTIMHEEKVILISNTFILNKIMANIHKDTNGLYTYAIVNDTMILCKINPINGPYTRFDCNYLFYSPKDPKYLDSFSSWRGKIIELTRLK